MRAKRVAKLLLLFFFLADFPSIVDSADSELNPLTKPLHIEIMQEIQQVMVYDSLTTKYDFRESFTYLNRIHA